ncbi:MAG TPA: c-type cytochrome, partial [Vicinamibacteria bacterium]|nr:c-type cytochrome [Vicinamibacteria bacterium]
MAAWTLAATATLSLAAPSEPGPPRNARAGRGPGDPTVKAWVVYDQHCVACHGRNLEGGAAGSLIDGVWTFGGDDAHVVETIREGRKGTAMVAFKDALTEEQIWQLVILIRQQ